MPVLTAQQVVNYSFCALCVYKPEPGDSTHCAPCFGSFDKPNFVNADVQQMEMRVK